MQPEELAIKTLGKAEQLSPLAGGEGRRVRGRFDFISDDHGVPYEIFVSRERGAMPGPRPVFEQAGPRSHIYFEPGKTRAAIVTCGGLCPGLNDVVRAIVMELHYSYGIGDVLGVRYGYRGLAKGAEPAPVRLDREEVSDIHRAGGSYLGCSRAFVDAGEMVDTLERLGVQVLFCIGGEGTLNGAHAIATEAEKRGLRLSVVGVPKTIDNDIDLVYHSFGFETAVAEARAVLDCAHNEAKGNWRGIGLVKLMGRDSGFVAAHASLASGDVNYCLVPEVPFELWGERGILPHLRERMARRGHAVIAVAEGAGREAIERCEHLELEAEPSLRDVGPFLKRSITQQFEEWGEPVSVKYFDPSYAIRSVAANAQDSIFCGDLARAAVHAAMAGRTDLMIGRWHGVFTHVPLELVAGRRKLIQPVGGLWRSVLASTGQPVQNLDAAAAVG